MGFEFCALEFLAKVAVGCLAFFVKDILTTWHLAIKRRWFLRRQAETEAVSPLLAQKSKVHSQVGSLREVRQASHTWRSSQTTYQRETLVVVRGVRHR